MISLYLTPSHAPGWLSVTFRCGRRAVGRPTVIPAGDAWQVSNPLYRAALAYNVGAVSDMNRKNRK